jgi:hypothetical protein
MPKEKIIIIDGQKNSAEDIENKIKLLKANTDYLVLATNIVSIGVDAPFGFVSPTPTNALPADLLARPLDLLGLTRKEQSRSLCFLLA